MALEVTGFDIQVKTQSFETGARKVARNLRRLGRQADAVSKRIDAVFKLRDKQVVGAKAFKRLAQLQLSAEGVTASLGAMAAAGKAADASLTTSAAATSAAMARALAEAQRLGGSYANLGNAAKKGAADENALAGATAKTAAAQNAAAAAAAKLAAARATTYRAGAAGYAAGIGGFMDRARVSEAMTAANRSILQYSAGVASATASQGRFQRLLSGTMERLRGIGAAAGLAGKQVVASTAQMQAGLAGAHAGAMKLRYLLASLGGFLVLREAIGTLKEYEFRMSGVQAITRATTQEMEAMDARARYLGATTMRFAQEAAHGMRQFAQAGFTATEAIAAIEGALDLSIAGTTDMGVAVEITANAIRGFNLEATEAGRVADVLAVAATRSNTTIALLGESLRYVAPVAAAVNMEIETTAAAIGIMGNAGIKGSMAGATLRRIISSLVEPTTGAMKALENLNLEAKDLDPTLQSTTAGVTRFVEVLRTLKQHGMGAREAFAIFGLRGGPGATALVLMIDRFEELERAAFELRGEAKRMAEYMGRNLRGELLRLRSAVQENIIAWGDKGLTGSLTKAVETMTLTARMWAGMTSPLEKGAEAAYNLKVALEALATVMIVYFGAKAINALVVGMIKATTSLVGFKLSVAGVTVALRGLAAAIVANPIGAIAVAVGAAAGMFYLWRERVLQGRKEVERLNATLADTEKLLKQMEGLSPTQLLAYEAPVEQKVKAHLQLIHDAFADIDEQRKKIAARGNIFQDIWGQYRAQPGRPIALSISSTLIERKEERRVLDGLNDALVKQRDIYIDVIKKQNTINKEKARQKRLEEDILRIQQNAQLTMEAMGVSQQLEREMEVMGATGPLRKKQIEARQEKEIEEARLHRIIEQAKANYKLAESQEARDTATEAITQATITLNDVERHHQAVINENIRESEAYTSALSDQESILESIQTPQQKLTEQLDRIAELQGMVNYETGEALLTQKQAALATSEAVDAYIDEAEALHNATLAMESFDSAVQGYASSLQAVKTPTEKYNEALELLTQRHERIWGVHAQTAEAQEELARMVDLLTDSFIDQEEAFQYLERGMDSLQTVTDRWQSAIEGFKTPLQEYHEALEQIAKDYERLVQAQGETPLLQQQRALAEDQAGLRRIRGEQAAEAQRKEDAMTRATSGMPTYARDYVESTGLIEMGDVIEKMGSQQLPILSDAFSDFFGDLITGSADAKQALLSLANEVARSGTRIIVEYLMSQALQKAFKPQQLAGVGGPGGAALELAGMSQQIGISPGSQTVSGGGQPGWMKIVGPILQLGSMVAGGIGGAASGAWGALSGLFGAGSAASNVGLGPGTQLPASNVTYEIVGHRGGIAGDAMPKVAVNPAVFAGAQHFATGGMVGLGRVPYMGRLGLNDVPAILHRGELVSPLKGGRLPVTMTGGGSGFTRTPGGTTVGLDIEGDNDGWKTAPVIFQRGAVTVVAQKGERLDETAAQAVRRAFSEGARQSRRNRR
jgi:TP901 family phage tail tape measure protein